MASFAQDILEGTLMTKEGDQNIPLEGANLYWLGTQIGTTTDDQGKFSLPYSNPNPKLVISFLGFKSDTLTVKNQKTLTHFLTHSDATSLEEVTISQRRKAIQKSYLEAQNISFDF